MRYIYADNYRGFSDALVQIKDVNFLVGENSTGKTSILALIELLSADRFLFWQRANLDDVRLGMFKDVVSVDSPEQRHFSIGFAEVAGKPGEKPDYDFKSYAFLARFTEVDGMPEIKDLTYTTVGERWRVRFGGRTIRVRHEGRCELVGEHEPMKNLFQSWATAHREVGKGYTALDIPFMPSAERYLLGVLDVRSWKRRGLKPPEDYNPFRRRYAFGNVVWLAPIRTSPLRTYDTYRLEFSPEGEHTPYLIKRLLSRRTNEERKRADRFIEFMEWFGRDSGLFKSIVVKDYAPRTRTSPFALDIVLTKQALSMANVGYGVSQALPVVVELFAQPRGTLFAIQQPEIHLHPRAQAAIGDALYGLSQLDDKRFVVETHSDFTIDGYRRHYQDEETERKPDAHIVFFEHVREGNKMHGIDILESGDISPEQPATYRQFFIREQMRLLGLSDVCSD